MEKMIRNMLVLVAIMAVSSLLLGFSYELTLPRITAVEKEKFLDSLKEIFPSADDYSETGEDHYEVISSGSAIGRAVAVSRWGFSSEIRLLIGFDRSMKLKGVRVLSHGETPGIGSKIAEPGFLSQFSGSSSFDAITGATVSSTAVIDAVKEAINETTD